jgi:hypothetical protein
MASNPGLEKVMARIQVRVPADFAVIADGKTTDGPAALF